MRKDITIVAEPREAAGKNEARRLRARGLLPAVVYGVGGGALPVSVSPKELTKILHSKSGHNSIFDVEIRGQGKAPVMIVDWQPEPVRGSLLHVDLKRIDLTKRISVKVPVHTQGDAPGVKQQGGLLELVTREIEIECLPDDIPEHFTVDVSNLMLGQNLRASEVPLTGSIKLKSSPETVICHVVTIRVVEEAAPAEVAPEGAAAAPAAAAPAEPEVIKKGKKEEAAEPETKPAKKK